VTDFDHFYPRDTSDLDPPAVRSRDGEYVPVGAARPIAKCRFCGRRVVVHYHRLRDHRTPDNERLCPGSGAKVAP
jgi:hypothetical protein